MLKDQWQSSCTVSSISADYNPREKTLLTIMIPEAKTMPSNSVPSLIAVNGAPSSSCNLISFRATILLFALE